MYTKKQVDTISKLIEGLVALKGDVDLKIEVSGDQNWLIYDIKNNCYEFVLTLELDVNRKLMDTQTSVTYPQGSDRKKCCLEYVNFLERYENNKMVIEKLFVRIAETYR